MANSKFSRDIPKLTDNNPYSALENHNEQQNIEHEQDKELDKMILSLNKVKGIGRGIEKEIVNQEPLIDDVNFDLELGNTRLNNTNKDLDKLIRTSSTKYWCCIGMLLIACTVFLILVLTNK